MPMEKRSQPFEDVFVFVAPIKKRVLFHCHVSELVGVYKSCELTTSTSGAECVPAVFVVTSLRTASTSILHMLNQIPGLLDDFNQCRLGTWEMWGGEW